MATQKTKDILGRLITKVKSMLTQLNKNTTAIKGKQDTLTKVITLEYDDGTTEDIKVA